MSGIKVQNILRLSFIIGLFMAALFCQSGPAQSPQQDLGFYVAPVDSQPLSGVQGSNVKNIIFLIGDGMGLGQVNAARLRATGADGMLHLERMPVIGLSRTHSGNQLNTDSAAAGTALASGLKTDNLKVSVDSDGKKHLTILSAAQSRGKSTGLVVTSTMTHATPAAFGSHVVLRREEDRIAEQYIDSRINVLLGGGKQFFLPKSVTGSARTEERNLIAEAEAAGYQFVDNKEDLKLVESQYLLGLFQMAALTTEPPEPSLAEMTEKAIQMLSKNKKGFFLMVEGSQIDWAGHANDIDRCVKQTLLFDMAVKVAQDFALKDRRTLVIVTADHETGGLAVVGGELTGQKIDTAWTTKGHTPVQVPVYAFGPGAQRFAGVYDNTEIPRRMANLLNIDDFPKVLN